jgi:hypothetical protein
MPTATYKSGATTLPVWPTYRSLGTKPASTAALEAPTAQFYDPRASANSYRSLKFSPLLRPRPPLTTNLALARSADSETEA